MVAPSLSFLALYAAVFLLLLGMGLLGTLLSLRLTIGGVPAPVTGLIMAAYYAGLVLGSFFCHHLVERVGHIRAFAAFAAVTTATVMLHGLYVSPLAWGILRLLTGMTTIGLYMVIESWLSECSEPRTRGRVFSIYMVLSYLGLGLGQLLLNLGDASGPALFFVTGIFLVLCLVPVAVTRSIHPEIPRAVRFNLLALLRRAPLGMLGCLAAGLVNSAFYAMGPVFGSRIGLSVSEVSVFMSATIFGGLLFQWPVGAISDRCDRTRVLPLLAASMAGVSLLVMLTARLSFAWLLASMGVFGGLAFTVYPVAMARTHDLFEARDIVSVSSALLLSYGIGASIGPIAASGWMALVKSPYGLYLYCAMAGALYAAAGFYFRRREIVAVVPVADQVQFVPMQNTSPVAMALDPRAPSAADNADETPKPEEK